MRSSATTVAVRRPVGLSTASVATSPIGVCRHAHRHPASHQQVERVAGVALGEEHLARGEPARPPAGEHLAPLIGGQAGQERVLVIAARRPRFFMGVTGVALNYSIVILIMVCLFTGRAVVRLSRRCAGFHAPAGVLS